MRLSNESSKPRSNVAQLNWASPSLQHRARVQFSATMLVSLRKKISKSDEFYFNVKTSSEDNSPKSNCSS